MLAHLLPHSNGCGVLLMKNINGDLMRQLVVGVILSATALVLMVAMSGLAGAADMPGTYVDRQPAPRVQACAGPQETVILYDEEGVPTVPGRTPYYYCVTHATLLPGELPPPREYCCG